MTSRAELRYDTLRSDRQGGLRVSIMVRAALAGLLIMGMAALSAPNSSPVTFNKDVLPVLQKNCQGCHRPGEVAPMSLLTYADARPWAKAMKNAVVNKQMPPWLADGHSRPFANDA